MTLPLPEDLSRFVIAGLCFSFPVALILADAIYNFLAGSPRHFEKRRK